MSRFLRWIKAAAGSAFSHWALKKSSLESSMYRDILVLLDPSPDSDARLVLAAKLAAIHGARLTGVDVSAGRAFEPEWLVRTTSLPDLFGQAVKGAQIAGFYTTIDRWVSAGRHDYAHYADLIVAGQPAFEAKELVAAGVPEEVLVSSGVPMLLLPYGWKGQSIGERIAIAWKSSREATRAVHDALPFLRRAKEITAFTFGPNPDGSGEEPDALIEYLARREVKAEAARWWPDGRGMTPVSALFASLDTQNVDMVVAGAYGHSRWAEALLGGVSRDLIRQPSLPVLLSH
jgi:nucleotide-binding universal stress UspA family protein